jgi:Rod binding domain-containing protein
MQINPSQIKPLVPGVRTPEQQLAAARELKQAYSDFVGKTFFGQMLKAMRSTQEKPAYFHGGRAEEIFQQQFDQVLTEEMTKSGAEQFTGPMFELFNAGRR